MNQTYFLGANTKAGFYSLYSGFPSQKGDLLHIIKGGPGTGKSSFMRTLGKAAEKQGYDVEYVLCSGDPDSLDGVYIPGLHTAWVDGTAPHVIEPYGFRIDSDYVNLGVFCNHQFSDADKDYVNQILHSYKALYDRAYGYISAAAALRDAALPHLFDADERAVVCKRVDRVLDRSLGKGNGKNGHTEQRFLSAVSCLGKYKLNEEISKLCKLIYRIDNGFGGAHTALEHAANSAVQRGAQVICCPSPVDPARLEAVLLPESGLAFTDGSFETDGARHIRIDALISPEKQQALRPELRGAHKLADAAMDLAYEKLRQAKALHDEMEEVYKAHMDFPALTEYTGEETEKLLNSSGSCG